MKNFGIRLKNLRNDRGLTIEELARELKLTSISIKLWENGKTVFSIKNVVLISQYFNVSTDYILGL